MTKRFKSFSQENVSAINKLIRDAVKAQKRLKKDYGVDNVVLKRSEKDNVQRNQINYFADDYLNQKEYTKFDLTELQFNTDFDAETIRTIVTKVYNKHKVEGRRLSINLTGTMKTVSEKKNDYSVNALSPSYTQINSEADIATLVNKFIQINSDNIDKMAKKSDIVIEVVEFRLNVIVKVFENDRGGSYVVMNERINDILFNPHTKFACFWHCLNKAEVKLTKTRAEICDLIGMNYNSYVSVKNIKNILNYVESRVKIILWKFSDKTHQLVKSTVIPRVGRSDIVLNILIVYNHYLLFTDIRRKHHVSVSDFECIDDDEVDDVLLNTVYKSEKMKPKQKELLNHTENQFFWDCEAHTNDKGDHIPYNIGVASFTDAINGNITVKYGFNCFDWFISKLRIMAYKAQQEHELIYCCPTSPYYIKNDKHRRFTLIKTKQSHKLTFWAHNAGRYDHFLLLKKCLEVNHVIMSNGILSMSIFNSYIEFKDFYRLAPSSLSDLCKSFKLPSEYCKTEFPHDFINAVKDIEYIGACPDAIYWPSKHIPDYINTSSEFDLKSISIEYQKLDVIALARCYDAYCKIMYDVIKLDSSKRLTCPSVAYTYLLNTASEKYDVEIIKNLKIDRFLRQSVRGGRTFVQKSYFQERNYHNYRSRFDNMSDEERLNTYNSIDEFLTDFDATSLYPSSMALYEYPTGKADVIYDQEELNRIMKDLNSLKYNRHAILRCDIEFNVDKSYCTPLIFFESKYTFQPKKEIIITSVDIMEAVKYNNAVVTKVHHAVEWKEKGFIFRDAIINLFNLRLKHKTEALGDVCKVLMNSSYGKIIMKLIEKSTKIISENKEFEKYLDSGNVSGFTMLSDEQILLQINNELDDDYIKTPAHLGCFILSYSKLIMNQCINAFDGFKNWDNTFYYTDTDSLIISNKVLSMLESVTVKYPANDKAIPMVGKQLGQLHDDIDVVANGKIIRAIWVRPKCYILEVIGFDKDLLSQGIKKVVIKYHVRSKGVNKKYLNDIPDEQLMEQYESMMMGGSVKYDNISRFKRSWKNKQSVGIKTVYETKEINREPWKGRVYNMDELRWYPIF